MIGMKTNESTYNQQLQEHEPTTEPDMLGGLLQLLACLVLVAGLSNFGCNLSHLFFFLG